MDKGMFNVNRWCVMIGTSMLGIACMLLIGVTVYNETLALDPVPAWSIPASVTAGLIAGGLFSYALQKLLIQWMEGKGRQ